MRSRGGTDRRAGRVVNRSTRLERALVRPGARRLARDPEGTRHDPSLPVGTDLVPKIEHIVILMMENHSYDSYLGMLGATEGRGDGFTLGSDGLPTASNPTKTEGEFEAATQWPTTMQVCDLPSQSWHAAHYQWHRGACDGFVRSAEDIQASPEDRDVPMRYFSEADLPFYYDLARTFPLADRWFSSCLGPTFPNRRFLIAGTAHGLIDDIPFGLFDRPKNGTIFDALIRSEIAWTNYHQAARSRIVRVLVAPILRLLRVVGLTVSDIVPSLKEAVVGRIQFTADLYPLGMLGRVSHVRPIDRFWNDAANGTLDAVSIVDPDFDRRSEESPQDVRCGEAFAAAVIDAVMTSPDWATTLLIWTYDEHGGYYDHVSPPAATSPDDVHGRSLMDAAPPIRWLLKRLGKWNQIEAIDKGPKRYSRFGFRVPTVFVSPYARKNHVSSIVYDHTSILKLIEHKWNLPPLTARDAAAADPLDDMLDLDSPDPPFMHPPNLHASAKIWQAGDGSETCRPACPKRRPTAYPSVR